MSDKKDWIVTNNFNNNEVFNMVGVTEKCIAYESNGCIVIEKNDQVCFIGSTDKYTLVSNSK
jgi:hypothetical protein